MDKLDEVPGFRDLPYTNPNKSLYRGRLALSGVQWTGNGADIFATATVTLAQIADACESRVLWTDQSVQRGLVPTAPADTARELPLADGYPDRRFYIFDAENADRLTERLLEGDRMFLSPLVWNLRPGTFEAYWSSDTDEVLLYDGRIFLPDSHHRHQAILKAVRAYRASPKSHPKLDLARQFKVELYFLDRADEGNYFFDKNQRPKPTALSKAYDLTTEDDLSVLAKRVLERSPALAPGVNRVTDRLSKKAPHFITLSTLREMMRAFAGSDEVEETELEGLAVIAAEFFEMLSVVRPELRVETPHIERDRTLASAGVMMHGYGVLMRDFNRDLAGWGPVQARKRWRERLETLRPGALYSSGGWTGDFLDKDNPLWLELGITKRLPGRDSLSVFNTGGTRTRAGRALREHVMGMPTESGASGT